MRRSNLYWFLAPVVGVLGCNQAPPPVAKADKAMVLVSRPTTDEVTDSEEFTGRSESVMSVEVRARVTGYLDKVNFSDGAEVNEGDLLFEIDPRPYQAEMDRTEAAVLQSEARLKRLQAEQKRAATLFARATISREEFDRTTGDYEEARAAVGIAVASRDLAKLNLGFTKVKAPISGRASRRLVDPGNLVKADETALTSIVTLDPLYVYFDIDERTLLRIRRLIQEGKMKSRAEAEVPIFVGLSDEEGFPHPGSLNFSENKVDPSTGTLRVRGVIENPRPKNPKQPRYLSPGLFVRIKLPIGAPHHAIMVPEQALGTDQGRKFLYIVNDKDEVVRRNIDIGPAKSGMRVVEKGIAPSDRIIVSGLQRVREGAAVRPKFADASLESAAVTPGTSPGKDGPAATPGKEGAASASAATPGKDGGAVAKAPTGG